MNNKEFKKKYWKLPSQLRLEFAYHLDKLNENYRYLTLSFIWAFAVILFGIFVMSMLFYMAFDNPILFKMFEPIIFMLKYILVALIVIDVLRQIEKHKKINKLEKLFLNGKGKL